MNKALFLLFSFLFLFVGTPSFAGSPQQQNNSAVTEWVKESPAPKVKKKNIFKRVADDGKTVALIAYLTLIGFIIAIVMHGSNKTSLGSFHLAQMMGLMLTGLVCAIIPILGWICSIGVLVMWIMGLISAINGEEKPVFLLGNLYQKWFGGMFD